MTNVHRFVCILFGTVTVLFLAACNKPVNNEQVITRTASAQANVSVISKTFVIPGLERERKIRLYLPPGYDSETDYYPVLYMHDGQNLFDDATSYAGEWKVDESLNELANDHGFKIIVVGIDNGGEHRMTELSAYDHQEFGQAEGEEYLNFIVNIVKPHIDTHYRTKADIKNTGIMGSSMGGLMSHYAIYTKPDVFSKAGIYSPSFWYSDEAFSLTTNNPLPKTAKLDFLVGTKEGEGMEAGMQQMVTLIENQNHPAKLIRSEVVVGGEHSEAFWASRFKQSVLWLYQ